MAASVLVLGGGIGGLSAAHELIGRGFAVTVVEQRAVPGGKARSLQVPGSALPPKQPLPGEHGFRFFPHFYRHIVDTMARTPVGSGNAAQHLVEAQREMLAIAGHPPITLPTQQPKTAGQFVTDLVAALMTMPTLRAVGLVEADFVFFAWRLWELMTTCPQRALRDFENQSWWDFMQADAHSQAFRQFFVEGVTRCLVAARAKVANVRAGGLVLTQLVYSAFDATPGMDRLLDGPTSPVWIDPWAAWLAGRGVDFRFGERVAAIACDGRRVTGVQVVPAAGAPPHTLVADHYVCALPIEYTAPLLSAQLLAADPSLAGIARIAGNVYDMTGIQFYLAPDVPLVHGHLLFADSPWALTGISQRQFWPSIDFTQLGDGRVEGILSVDISDWDTPGIVVVDLQAPPGPDGRRPCKTARQCTRDEVALEVWTQMRVSLTAASGVNPLPPLPPRSFIDPGMVFAPTPVSNDSRLFVNQVGSWPHRPDAATRIPNLFLASDYVRTDTNLATMEAANEAARRAVNALLQATGSTQPPCQLWPLPLPDALKPFVDADRRRFDLGLPWTGALI